MTLIDTWLSKKDFSKPSWFELEKLVEMTPLNHRSSVVDYLYSKLPDEHQMQGFYGGQPLELPNIGISFRWCPYREISTSEWFGGFWMMDTNVSVATEFIGRNLMRLDATESLEAAKNLREFYDKTLPNELHTVGNFLNDSLFDHGSPYERIKDLQDKLFEYIADFPVGNRRGNLKRLSHQIFRERDFKNLTDAYGGKKMSLQLPTQNQWEFVVREGTEYTFGVSGLRLQEAGVFEEKQQQPLRSKKPNAWGIYDLIGNVWELLNTWTFVGGAYNEELISYFQSRSYSQVRSSLNDAYGYRFVLNLE